MTQRTNGEWGEGKQSKYCCCSQAGLSTNRLHDYNCTEYPQMIILKDAKSALAWVSPYLIAVMKSLYQTKSSGLLYARQHARGLHFVRCYLVLEFPLIMLICPGCCWTCWPDWVFPSTSDAPCDPPLRRVWYVCYFTGKWYRHSCPLPGINVWHKHAHGWWRQLSKSLLEE